MIELSANRVLYQSILDSEVRKTVRAWVNAGGAQNAVLIGGLALAIYTRPRYTQDADFIFLHKNDIPKEVEGFKKHRKLAFEYKKTGVEIETVCNTDFHNLSLPLIKKVFDTSLLNSGIRVASPEGLVALKLVAGRLQDEADIVAVLKEYPNLSLKGWDLSNENLLHLEVLKEKAKKEKEERASLKLDE